jgi:hypothetical protein
VAVKPSGPTQPDIDPPSYFLNRIRLAIAVVADLIRFSPVVFYFWAYWSNKELLRRGLRTGALSFLSISILCLWSEIIVELTTHQVVAILPHTPRADAILMVLFTLSVAILVFHHQKELRHRHAEFVLAERLWEFMMRRDTDSWDGCIDTATRLFRDIFERFGIAHVSVALPVDGELVIDPKHVWPREENRWFYERLPLDDGVGGWVYYDGKPRYVPRLFYPFNGFTRHLMQIFFPHAMVFEIKKDPRSPGRIELVQPTLDFNVFKTSVVEPFVFKSFVSVPLKARSSSKCIGVLNFDFKTTDPLIRVDIKTAVVLGLILADELERIRPTAVAAPARSATSS